jgi:DNA-binding PadR family transcriptional regulator
VGLAPGVETPRATYKAYSLSESRKFVAVDGKRFGYLEYLVLDFASKHALIQAASVREYLKQQGVEANLKRIHDALQRLMRKGVVEKVSRGIYRLTDYGRKILSALLAQRSKARKESEFKAVRSYGGVYADGGVFSRARLHAVGARGLEDLARQLYALYRAVGCALSYLRLLLGRSRFYRIVRGVDVACVDFFVGGHGTGLTGKSRSLKRPLIVLSYFVSLGVKPREIGVDVLAVVAGLSRVSVKVYFG